ncbi:MAG: hypothetical protein AAF702_44395 [Chloroflexota bacterium]
MSTFPLQWLANQLVKHKLTEFSVEVIQPSWIIDIASQRIYILLSRTLIGVVLFLASLIAGVPFPNQVACFVASIGIAIVDIIRLTYNLAPAHSSGASILRFMWACSAIGASSLCAFAAFWCFGNMEQAMQGSLSLGAFYGFLGNFGRPEIASLENDIEPFCWGNKPEIRVYCVQGLIYAAIIGTVITFGASRLLPLDTFFDDAITFLLIGMLFLVKSFLGDDGLYHQQTFIFGFSFGYAFGTCVGILLGLVIGLGIDANLHPETVLYSIVTATQIGIAVGVVGILIYGFVNTVKYWVLRGILHYEHLIPFDFKDVLERELQSGNLQRTPSGYSFSSQFVDSHPNVFPEQVYAENLSQLRECISAEINRLFRHRTLRKDKEVSESMLMSLQLFESTLSIDSSLDGEEHHRSRANIFRKYIEELIERNITATSDIDEKKGWILLKLKYLKKLTEAEVKDHLHDEFGLVAGGTYTRLQQSAREQLAEAVWKMEKDLLMQMP